MLLGGKLDQESNARGRTQPWCQSVGWNFGVSPEEQPEVQLQERELRKEASSWFSKDALTVPGFKCQCLYIHMPYRYFHFGGLPGLEVGGWWAGRMGLGEWSHCTMAISGNSRCFWSPAGSRTCLFCIGEPPPAPTALVDCPTKLRLLVMEYKEKMKKKFLWQSLFCEPASMWGQWRLLVPDWQNFPRHSLETLHLWCWFAKLMDLQILISDITHHSQENLQFPRLK